MRISFYLLIACLFAACSPVNYIGIQTYNPANITFPKNVRKLLVVDNALPQPSDVGYQYSLFGKAQDTCRANADSASFFACRSLGKSIVSVPYFRDVLLYDRGTRQDSQYLIDKKMSSDDVKALCEETGADAVISFDRLLFKMEKTVVAFADGYIAGMVDVKMNGVVRSYIPEREQPLATVYMNDSIYWMENAGDLNELARYLPSPSDALRAAAEYLGTKASPNFIPHWIDETRWYYKGIGTRWKEASAYAAAEKWDEAYQRWMTIYEKSSSWKEKAKVASNLALYYEMDTKLKEAFDWASKSYALYEKNAGAENQYTKMQKLYMDALSERLASDTKLNMQIDR